ncbi:alpha/beta fold hydrolase [Propioniciclava coleopterorum]|uniref:alpha/beta fold hydrolase n=1 Tax=Propioniciclava coleopterorum TaxID=2714937 RepID=UPI001FE77ECC|nr:alpha/beta fold hydrolase [Propioniciclava coleopterorum]
MHGEADPGVPIAAARRAAASIRGAELVEIPRGGHWVQRDSPELVAEAVLGFLTRLPV